MLPLRDAPMVVVGGLISLIPARLVEKKPCKYHGNEYTAHSWGRKALISPFAGRMQKHLCLGTTWERFQDAHSEKQPLYPTRAGPCVVGSGRAGERWRLHTDPGRLLSSLPFSGGPCQGREEVPLLASRCTPLQPTAGSLRTQLSIPSVTAAEDRGRCLFCPRAGTDGENAYFQIQGKSA